LCSGFAVICGPKPSLHPRSYSSPPPPYTLFPKKILSPTYSVATRKSGPIVCAWCSRYLGIMKDAEGVSHGICLDCKTRGLAHWGVKNPSAGSHGAYHGALGRGENGVRELARIMHEPPAATADLAVLPGVLGSRTLRRTEQVRLRSEPLWLPGGTTISTISRPRRA